MKGYEFKTVSEMLEQGTPEAVAECYELKPGDNSRYDALFGDGTTRIRRGAEASKGMPVSKALAGT
jgi:hypothetical protein